MYIGGGEVEIGDLLYKQRKIWRYLCQIVYIGFLEEEDVRWGEI